jgi:hypothetical protein
MTEQITTTEDLVPLAHLVLEGVAGSVDELAGRVEVVRDDIGLRCVTRETARLLIAEKAEADEQREALWQRQQQEVVQRGLEAQAAVAAGVPAPAGLEHMSAVQLLGVASKQERLDAAGDRWEDYASGGITYRPLDPEGTAHE